MVTLKTLEQYQKLHSIIEDFLRDRCDDYNTAKKYADFHYHKSWTEPLDIFIGFEIQGDKILIRFEDPIGSFDPEGETYELPLNILFDDDFYKKIRSHFGELKKQEDEETATKQRQKDLALLAKLKEKYEV